ncbi:putative FAD-binding dehydrogenase [Planctomycetes bacterium Pan216]|uniref:Putative FAD-binding dehydrogenase n=1 Tax=Kolteria novifilia TaxID=2527975 RepID=A0A518AY42_9BACT|nr:putative FAD-binding dehydrogenase [Planctomycetes bacterium Pan216]
MDWDVAVIGAGAAGLLAATRAAERGKRTILLEKNRKPGVKILISGGTRCNLTHATDARGIVKAFGNSGKFLHGALAALSPQDVIKLVENEGVATKREATGKIFPASDRALDVQRALLGRLTRSGAALSLDNTLEDIDRAGEAFVLRTSSGLVIARSVIVTTGGMSYPGCGTTGDGYRWAKSFGHRVVTPRPALVPVMIDDAKLRDLKGITIEDVAVRLLDTRAASRKKGILGQDRGSLLFTHFGLSGPVILDMSRAISAHATPKQLRILCDFLPETNLESLESRLRSETLANGKRSLTVMLGELLPRRLVELLVEKAGVPSERRLAELTRGERRAVVERIKSLELPVESTKGFAKAEVTAGGVSLAEVDSRDMQSKLVKGLYWAGEVLDLDGRIGGFNFQAAFSTGWLAGEKVE